jgi:hypothetical protein
VAELDGVWRVHRSGGLLPPLYGERKRIQGDRGWTTVGPVVRAPFRVVGRELRYAPPLQLFVDVLEPDGAGRFRGRALVAGREYGRFTMESEDAAAPPPRGVT